MTYRTISTYVDVDVDLDEFDTDDLIEELESRGIMVSAKDGDATHSELLVTIWEKRRMGKDFQFELDQLIYNVLGKVI
jgi:hypothetical protein